MYIFESSVLVPPNGLVVYCGTIITDEGKEKKVGSCGNLVFLSIHLVANAHEMRLFAGEH